MKPEGYVRVARVILIIAAAGLAAVPLLLLLNLASGGDAFGLCPGGLIRCRNPYRSAPELSAVLTATLFVVLAGLRGTTVLKKRLRDR